jgi:hypothetical protein
MTATSRRYRIGQVVRNYPHSGNARVFWAVTDQDLLRAAIFTSETEARYAHEQLTTGGIDPSDLGWLTDYQEVVEL